MRIREKKLKLGYVLVVAASALQSKGLYRDAYLTMLSFDSQSQSVPNYNLSQTTGSCTVLNLNRRFVLRE